MYQRGTITIETPMCATVRRDFYTNDKDSISNIEIYLESCTHGRCYSDRAVNLKKELMLKEFLTMMTGIWKPIHSPTIA